MSEWGDLKRHLSEQLDPTRLKTAVEKALRALRQLDERISSKLGTTSLPKTLSLVRKAADAIAGSNEATMLSNLIGRLEEAGSPDLATCRTAASAALECTVTENLERCVLKLGQVPFASLQRFDRLLLDLESTLNSVDRLSSAEEQTLRDTDPGPVAEELLQVMSDCDALLERIANDAR
jgi:hypothetical protein